jgi:hypothetical protein
MLNPGDRLAFRTFSDEGNTARGCRYPLATWVDPRVLGPSDLTLGFGINSWLFKSRDRIESAPQCQEALVTSAFLSSPETDPFAVPVPGQLPPVLLGLLLTGNQGSCASCVDFWVVKVTRAGPP